MISISSVRTLFRRSSRLPGHLEALPARELNLPVRVDDPATAARIALDLCRGRREELTLGLFLDERHRLVGHVVLSQGWVQAARLSARPILQGAQACRAESAILVRYGRSRSLTATEGEARSFWAMAAECTRHRLPVLDHVIVTEGGFASARFRRAG